MQTPLLLDYELDISTCSMWLRSISKYGNNDRFCRIETDGTDVDLGCFIILGFGTYQ